ncbi:hypothetical protein INR49_014331, partial [Caranx melampygus]
CTECRRSDLLLRSLQQEAGGVTSELTERERGCGGSRPRLVDALGDGAEVGSSPSCPPRKLCSDKPGCEWPATVQITPSVWEPECYTGSVDSAHRTDVDCCYRCCCCFPSGLM